MRSIASPGGAQEVRRMAGEAKKRSPTSAHGAPAQARKSRGSKSPRTSGAAAGESLAVSRSEAPRPADSESGCETASDAFSAAAVADGATPGGVPKDVGLTPDQ